MSQFICVKSFVLLSFFDVTIALKCYNTSTHGSPVIKHSVIPGFYLLKSGKKEADITCEGTAGDTSHRIRKRPPSVMYVFIGHDDQNLIVFTTKCDTLAKRCVARNHLNESSFKNYSFVNVFCQAVTSGNRCTEKRFRFDLVDRRAGIHHQKPDVTPATYKKTINNSSSTGLTGKGDSSGKGPDDNVLTIVSLTIGAVAFLFVGLLIISCMYRRIAKGYAHKMPVIIPPNFTEERDAGEVNDAAEVDDAGEVNEAAEINDKGETVETRETILTAGSAMSDESTGSAETAETVMSAETDLTDLEEIDIHYYVNIQSTDGIDIKIGKRWLYFTEIILGEGQFGKVIRGELIGEQERIPVAIKMLKACHRLLTVLAEYVDFWNESHRQDLLKEISSLEEVGNHKNIVKLMGAVKNNPGLPDMIVMEFLPRGALLNILRRSRCNDSRNPNQIISSLRKDQMLRFISEIAAGMEFLATSKIVHRDLAARNILVADDGTLKISDFGFARDISEGGKYIKLNGGYFPVEWMALESLISGVYTVQTDVWSFGVVIWEIFSLGEEPYWKLKQQMSVRGSFVYVKLVNALSGGYRMGKPLLCPEEMNELMQACWNKQPHQRPSFTELGHHANAMLEKEKEMKSLQRVPYPVLPEEV